MKKTKKYQDIEFETDYQLQEFMACKDQHFKANNKCWEGNHPANHIFIMEQMFELINQMRKEIILLRREILWKT